MITVRELKTIMTEICKMVQLDESQLCVFVENFPGTKRHYNRTYISLQVANDGIATFEWDKSGEPIKSKPCLEGFQTGELVDSSERYRLHEIRIDQYGQYTSKEEK